MYHTISIVRLVFVLVVFLFFATYSMKLYAFEVCQQHNFEEETSGFSKSCSYDYGKSWDFGGNIADGDNYVKLCGRSASNAQTIPVPEARDCYSISPSDDYKISKDAAIARPIGLGNCAIGGDNLDLKIGLAEFESKVDVYVALSLPLESSDNIFLLNPDNTFTSIDQGLVPWKSAFKSQIAETIFEGLSKSLLPYGSYNFYLIVTPVGDRQFNKYYFWQAKLMIGPDSFPKPGTWIGEAGFGSLKLELDSSGKKIEKIKYTFEDFSCDGVIRNGSIKVSNQYGWKISNAGSSNSFTVNTSFPQDPDFEMSISGSFEQNGNEAAGTWEALSRGQKCTGSWTASNY